MNRSAGETGTLLPCEACGEKAVSQHEVEQTFDYGDGDDAAVLRAVVPVYSCSACGLEYTDDEAEDIRHRAVCQHLGVLTPNDIRDLRQKTHGLSREDFSAITGISTASLARWETGALIQSPAYDRYLRLLHDPQVFARARGIAGREETAGLGAPRVRHFPRLQGSAHSAAAERFRLQKAG